MRNGINLSSLLVASLALSACGIIESVLDPLGARVETFNECLDNPNSTMSQSIEPCIEFLGPEFMESICDRIDDYACGSSQDTNIINEDEILDALEDIELPSSDPKLGEPLCPSEDLMYSSLCDYAGAHSYRYEQIDDEYGLVGEGEVTVVIMFYAGGMTWQGIGAFESIGENTFLNLAPSLDGAYTCSTVVIFADDGFSRNLECDNTDDVAAAPYLYTLAE